MLNVLFKGKTINGKDYHVVHTIPLREVVKVLENMAYHHELLLVSI